MKNLKIWTAAIAIAFSAASCNMSKDAQARRDYNSNVKKSEQCVRAWGTNNVHKHHKRHDWD